MESDTAEPERQAFEILELIDDMRDARWWGPSVFRDQNIDHLLENLEDTYRCAMEPWDEHRSTHDEMFQEDFYRWHESMFPADIYQEVQWRFNELVTTSRFSVEETICLHDLEEVHSTNNQIKQRHIVSLAVLVCVQLALEELAHIEFFDTQEDIELTIKKVDQARDLQKHADLWLEQLNTLNEAHKEAAFERRRQPIAASKNPRKEKTRKVTTELVAKRFKSKKPNEKWESIRNDLAATYGVSESTIDRRYRAAKKENLLS